MHIINNSFTNEYEENIIINDVLCKMFFWSGEDPADDPTYDWMMYSHFCANCGNYMYAWRTGMTVLHRNLRCVCVPATILASYATANVPVTVLKH